MGIIYRDRARLCVLGSNKEPMSDGEAAADRTTAAILSPQNSPLLEHTVEPQTKKT